MHLRALNHRCGSWSKSEMEDRLDGVQDLRCTKAINSEHPKVIPLLFIPYLDLPAIIMDLKKPTPGCTWQNGAHPLHETSAEGSDRDLNSLSHI